MLDTTKQFNELKRQAMTSAANTAGDDWREFMHQGTHLYKGFLVSPDAGDGVFTSDQAVDNWIRVSKHAAWPEQPTLF